MEHKTYNIDNMIAVDFQDKLEINEIFSMLAYVNETAQDNNEVDVTDIDFLISRLTSLKAELTK